MEMEDFLNDLKKNFGIEPSIDIFKAEFYHDGKKLYLTVDYDKVSDTYHMALSTDDESGLEVNRQMVASTAM